MADGQFHTYRADLGLVVHWRNDLNDLRLQPFGTTPTTGEELSIDYIEVGDVRRYESELLDYIQHTEPELYTTLAEAKKFDDDLATQLGKLVDDFTKQFQPTPDK